MYFLSAEEKQRLLKGLLPKAREMEIADELRGWNWNRAPLEPAYDITLGVYEVAGRYCPTNRDLYLRKVEKVGLAPNAAMVEGRLLHEILAQLIVEAKRLLYLHGANDLQAVTEALRQNPERAVPSLLQELGADNTSQAPIAQKAIILAQFESSRISARIEEIASRQPHIGVDSLVAQAVPVVVEQKLDGSFLGLSRHLSADACTFGEPMILDVKFGPREKFHRLGTAGYALVTEALYEYPVNLGCVVYVSFKDRTLTVDKDFHLIDDELRQWFIEERDEKARMLYNERDPGLADECPHTCPAFNKCRA